MVNPTMQYEDVYDNLLVLFTVVPCALALRVFFITETLHHAPCAGRGVAPSAATALRKPVQKMPNKNSADEHDTSPLQTEYTTKGSEKKRYIANMLQKKIILTTIHTNIFKLYEVNLLRQNIPKPIVPNTPSGHGCWLPRKKNTVSTLDDMQTSRG